MIDETKIDADEFLWCQKYRPQTIDECILPKNLKKVFSEVLRLGEVPNMILSGPAGIGKTTVAKALCNELGADVLFINASEESGIDVLRTKIKSFSSTVSLGGNTKIVILDEADYLSPVFQASLRAFIEEFSKNCRFIMTCNFSHRLIQPLHSRSVVIDFSIPKNEKPQLASEIFSRAKELLVLENVDVSSDAILRKLIVKYFPDFRKVLNELQRNSVNGSIDESILVEEKDEVYDALIEHMKDKNFKALRKWVVDHSIDDDTIYKNIYDKLEQYVKPGSIPAASVIIAEYMYKSAFVADKEINLVACLASLMVELEYK